MKRRFRQLFDEIAVVSHDGPLGVERVLGDILVLCSLPEGGDEVDVVNIVTIVSEPAAS